MAPDEAMGDRPDIRVRRVSRRRVRIKATRGAVTTEATLTEAEAIALYSELHRVLYALEPEAS